MSYFHRSVTSNLGNLLSWRLLIYENMTLILQLEEWLVIMLESICTSGDFRTWLWELYVKQYIKINLIEEINGEIQHSRYFKNNNFLNTIAAAYFMEDGKSGGLVNLYSLLPYGSECHDVFTDLTVSANGSLIAVSDASGKVYVANIQDVFNITNTLEER